MLVGAIGTLLGLLIMSLWLSPKVAENKLRSEGNKQEIKDIWDNINKMRNQINDIHIAVVEHKK